MTWDISRSEESKLREKTKRSFLMRCEPMENGAGKMNRKCSLWGNTAAAGNRRGEPASTVRPPPDSDAPAGVEAYDP